MQAHFKIFFSLLVSGLPLFSFAQIIPDFLPGSIILNNGDTISGYLEAISFEKVTNPILFKPTESAAAEKIPTGTFQKMIFEDGVTYQTQELQDSVQLFYVLVDSEADFLKKEDENKKTRYYLAYQDSLVELRYDTIQKDEDDPGRTNQFQVRVYPDYKLKLRKVYDKCIYTKKLKLYERPMKRRIHEGNECLGDYSIITPSRKKIIRIGTHFSKSLPTDNNDYDAYDWVTNVNFTFPGMSRKISFQAFIKNTYWYSEGVKESEFIKVGAGVQVRAFEGRVQPFLSLNINTPFRVNYGFGLDYYPFQRHALRLIMEREIFYIRFHMVGAGYVFTL